MNKERTDFCVRLNDLPKGIKAYDIYPQLMSQIDANVLALYIEPQPLKKKEFHSWKYLSMVEELLVKPNQHLAKKLPKLKPQHFQMIDPEILASYEKDPAKFSIRNVQKFTEPKNRDYNNRFDTNEVPEEELEQRKNQVINSKPLTDQILGILNKERASQGDACIAVLYDWKEKVDRLLIEEIMISGKMIRNFDEMLTLKYKERLFQSNKNLVFMGYYYSYEDFEVGGIQSNPKDKTKSLFRSYWKLSNIDDVGSDTFFKKVYFHNKSPERSDEVALLTFDLVFQVGKFFEIRISFDFHYVEVYNEKSKVYWIIHLMKHPACYFYPLRPHEYLAFHVKNWRRIPNFLVGAISDNIDKLYLANKSAVKLTFSQTYYQKHSKFFKEYEAKLRNGGLMKDITSSNYTFISYLDVPLMLNSEKMERAKVPYDIKFLIMVMISRSQLDIYTFPGDFLEKLWGVEDERTRPDMIKRAIEMFALNKKYDKKYISYDEYKKRHLKYLKMVRHSEKILSAYKTQKISLFSFDAALYNFEVQITPSCTYYLCSDLAISKSIMFKFEQQTDRFLLVKFCDENLNIIKAVRSVLEKVFYGKFLEEILILGRKYEFFSFNSLQLQNRAFWAFYSNEDFQAETILAFLETETSSNSSLEGFDSSSDSKIIELDKESFKKYMARVADQPNYSYDILEIKKENITVSRLSNQEAFKRNVMNRSDWWIEERVRAFTYEGLISGDLLDEISTKFNYGNSPGLIIRGRGRDILLIRDYEPPCKKSIRLYENIYEEMKSIKQYDIIEILRFRPAFLNKQLILLLESTMQEMLKKAYFHEEYKRFVDDMQIILSRFLNNLSSNNEDLCKRVIFGSKYANNVLEPIVSASVNFSKDPYFQNLFASINFKSNVDMYRKMKIGTEFGAYLLGIIDDTGNVKEDEVYYDIENPLGESSHKENTFPYVVVARKPYMDFSDIGYFKVNNSRFVRNAYKDLKNCVVFSDKDRKFVLDCCVKVGPFTRTNYFLVFWDQLLIPERLKKDISSGLDKNSNPQKKMVIDSDDSNTTSKEELKFSEPLEDKYQDDSDNSISYIRFNRFKSKMRNVFRSLIRYPRMKDIRNLHLAYVDASRERCRDEVARLLSTCYREFNFRNPLNQLQDESQIYYLLNILEGSKYLPVPFYIREVESSHIVNSTSLLGAIYKALKPSFTSKQFIPKKQEVIISQELIHKGFHKHLRHALKVLVLYKYDIQKLLFLYGCEQESDLFIGFNRRDEDFYINGYAFVNFRRDFINLKDYIRTLTKKYRQLFDINVKYKVINGKKKLDPDKADEVLGKASAWYIASLYPLWRSTEKLKCLLEDKEIEPLLIMLDDFEIKETYGLPWIAASDLLKEMRQKNLDRSSDSSLDL